MRRRRPEKTVHFSVRVISESQVYPAKLFSTKKRAQKVKNYLVLVHVMLGVPKIHKEYVFWLNLFKSLGFNCRF